ncbi:MAG: sigma-70 family RNA polymerase sigma factor [Proteobacteria bacterium]|nr:sigma-70 family RNA polymerase sigma factor [Pseudomonadota bacterium]
MADEVELRALLLKGLAGEEAAHRAFLMEAAALLRPYFRNRLRAAPDDAEDLVQETLVALHTRRDSYDPTLPLTAWMYAIARYRLIDFLRRKKRRGDHATIDDLEIGDADPQFEASDARRDVMRLLAKLPEKQRRAIELVKLQEHSVEEASKLTGYGVSDIKVSIHRGMKALMKLMAEENPA